MASRAERRAAARAEAHTPVNQGSHGDNPSDSAGAGGSAVGASGDEPGEATGAGADAQAGMADPLTLADVREVVLALDERKALEASARKAALQEAASYCEANWGPVGGMCAEELRKRAAAIAS